MRPSIRLPSEREVAIHEAGHAVVAAHLGWRLRTITIESDGSWLGHGSFSSPEIYRLRADRLTARGLVAKTDEQCEREVARSRARQGAVIAAAGFAATQFWRFGDVDASHPLLALCDPVRSVVDVEHVLTWAGATPSGALTAEPVERARRVYLRAAHILEPRPAWRAVLTLADALVDRRTLDGDEAAAIIGQARRSRPDRQSAS